MCTAPCWSISPTSDFYGRSNDHLPATVQPAGIRWEQDALSHHRRLLLRCEVPTQPASPSSRECLWGELPALQSHPCKIHNQIKRWMDNSFYNKHLLIFKEKNKFKKISKASENESCHSLSHSSSFFCLEGREEKRVSLYLIFNMSLRTDIPAALGHSSAWCFPGFVGNTWQIGLIYSGIIAQTWCLLWKYVIPKGTEDETY